MRIAPPYGPVRSNEHVLVAGERLHSAAMRRTAVVMCMLGALVLGACGDDDDDDGGSAGDVSEEEQPYVDAMAASFQEGEEGGLVMSEEQAECIAPRWMDTIGLERLQEAGVEPADIGDDEDDELTSLGLSEEEGGELYDAFGECDVDVQGLFIDSLAEDSDLSEEDRDCLAQNFDDDLLRRVMVASLTEGEEALQQDDELMSEVFAVFSECPGAAG